MVIIRHVVYWKRITGCKTYRRKMEFVAWNNLSPHERKNNIILP